jgi:hypothetical protein
MRNILTERVKEQSQTKSFHVYLNERFYNKRAKKSSVMPIKKNYFSCRDRWEDPGLFSLHCLNREYIRRNKIISRREWRRVSFKMKSRPYYGHFSSRLWDRLELLFREEEKWRPEKRNFPG